MRAGATLSVLLLLLATAGCEDAALRRLNERVALRIIEATAISANREAFEREASLLAQERSSLLAAFEAMEKPERLEAIVERAGGTVRLGSTGAAPTRSGRAVAFRVSTPGGARAMLGLQGDRRPVSIESLECNAEDCFGSLRALRQPAPRDPEPAITVDALPPRPIWPPERSRWERAKADLERLMELRAELGQVADVKERMEELKTLRDAIELVQRRADLVVQVAQDALDSGAAEVRVDGFGYEDGYGARVRARGASGALQQALARRGAVATDGEGYSVKVELPAKAALRKLLEKARSP